MNQNRESVRDRKSLSSFRAVLETRRVNPVPRTCVRGFGALPAEKVQNIHPRTWVRGVLWYGVKFVSLGFDIGHEDWCESLRELHGAYKLRQM